MIYKMWGCVCIGMKNSLEGDKFDITVTNPINY